MVGAFNSNFNICTINKSNIQIKGTSTATDSSLKNLE